MSFQLVSFHLLLRDKSLVTDPAVERPKGAVGGLVSSQMSLDLESPVALCARKRPLSRVRPLVIGQILLVGCPEVAVQAREGPLRVDVLLVPAQQALCPVPVGALVALKRLLVCVLPHLLLGAELVATDVALQWLFSYSIL